MLRKAEIKKKLDYMKTGEKLSMYDLGWNAGYRKAMNDVLNGIED